MGILAFELLVGYPPFEQESRAQVREAALVREGCTICRGEWAYAFIQAVKPSAQIMYLDLA